MNIPKLNAETLLHPGEGMPGDETGSWHRMRFSPVRVEGTAWHYTDAHGFLGILNTGQLWATASLALNDTSEVAYGEQIIKSTWKNADKSGLPQPCIDFTNAVLDFEFDDFAADGLFVVSASLNGDLLSQWRNYAGTDGFAVGLDTGVSLAAAIPQGSTPTELPPVTEPNSAGMVMIFNPRTPPGQLFVLPQWSQVSYDEVTQREQAADVLSDTVQSTPGPDAWATRTREWPAHIVGARSFLLTAAALMKHPAFIDEREVRLLSSKAYLGDAEQYRVRGGRLVPYVPVATSTLGAWQANDPSSLPISSVRHGPGSDFRALKVAASLLERRGYPNVQIDRSTIPISL
tara:strand:- start:2502 stop:3539 length:1038 start_codon:yes stop_codon:yes gene_type:complete